MSQTTLFSVHPRIHDKPSEWEPGFGNGWKPALANTLEGLRDHVTRGGAFIAAEMTSPFRTSAAFHSATHVVVDVDYGLTVEELLQHPLATQACFAYTTPSHDSENGKHRFRVVFRLPRLITSGPLLQEVTTILTAALGGDRSCTDCCRLFYGNSKAQVLLWQPEAVLPRQILDDANKALELRATRYDPDAPEADEDSLNRAIFVLEHVLDPTCDGERDKFIRISAAAAAGGQALFPAWSDWASRGHHGSGRNSKQSGQRFFDGLRGSSLGTLFFLANEQDADWRKRLPEELRSTGWGPGRTAVYGGYAHSDFMGDPLVEARPISEEVVSMFDPEMPWAKRVAVTREQDPPEAQTPVADGDAPVAGGYEDRDFLGDPLTPPSGGSGGSGGKGKGKSGKGKSSSGGGKGQINQVLTLVRRLYPGLRLNVLNQTMEYGPQANPQPVPDPSTTYVRISKGRDEVFPKHVVNDVMQVEATEKRYNPVIAYLEHCSGNCDPDPGFNTLGTELLGLSEDDDENPVLPCGRRLGDVAISRALIGAVARALDPGCPMDWMPILLGHQNLGKSTFFRYLAPPHQRDWVSTLQIGLNTLKEKPHRLHCGWIVVLDEVERYFKRQFVEELKNLVSAPIDVSARKYREQEQFPRNFILVAAGNGRDFFKDPTGNRRFIPIVCKGKVPSKENRKSLIIDLDALKERRDAIWAAAYQAYHNGEAHTFSSHEISHLSLYLGGFTADSSVADLALRSAERTSSGYYKDRSFLTLSDLFATMRVDTEAQSRLTLEVTDALKQEGWVPHRFSYHGRLVRGWFPPETSKEKGVPLTVDAWQ